MNPGQITVRRLLPEEAEVFRSIRLEALATSPEAFATTWAKAAADPLARFAQSLTEAAVFGVFLAGEIAGMAGLYREQGERKQHRGMLWGMYVRPAAQGRGLGRALLRAVLAHAESELEQVHLVVVSDNEPARRLYESEGFSAYGLEPHALKQGQRYLDEILMVRLLR
jgi:ribosomal protein S18 acetylase RimI-like enzyme